MSDHHPPVIPSKTSAWPDAPDYFEAQPDGFDVYSWSPAPPGTVGRVPVTQVHLHGITSLGRVLWRFKSPRTLDRLIDALIDHRRDVFGPRNETVAMSGDPEASR